MNKNKITQLIKEIAIKEMARIPLLYQLSTTNQDEINKLLPADLKNSGIAKNIIKYFIDNNNTPSSTISIAKAFGYKAQQPVNTQFQKLKQAGVLVDKGLAFAKKSPSLTLGNESKDDEKIAYVLNKFKKDEEPKDEYKEWFISKFSVEKYDELKNLYSKLKNTNLKDEYKNIKQQIKSILQSLGVQFKTSSSTDLSATNNDKTNDLQKVISTYSNEDDDEEEDDNLAKDEFGGVFENNPKPSKPLPAIKEPPLTNPGKTPKRRTLTPPDPTVKPTPKNEQKSEKYGWDQKKGLTQLKKPEIKGSNKPKEEKPKNENKGMLKKIVDKYTKLKNETKN